MVRNNLRKKYTSQSYFSWVGAPASVHTPYPYNNLTVQPTNQPTYHSSFFPCCTCCALAMYSSRVPNPFQISSLYHRE